jgi:RecJ-like exonuclease
VTRDSDSRSQSRDGTARAVGRQSGGEAASPNLKAMTPTTPFKVTTVDCPTCHGAGRNTGCDDGGFYAVGICDDCGGFGEVQASCACCDRIVPIDGEGFCRDCADDVCLTETVSDPMSGRKAA